MQFNLIGPFELVTGDGRTHTPKAPKICQMLAVLALQPGEAVATDTLIRELWGENAPGNAPKILQTHVYHARRMLDEALDTADRRPLVTQVPGYRLDIDGDQTDVHVFERLVRQAQRELSQGFPETAAAHLVEARRLWRGPMLCNVQVGPVLTGRVARMEELRIRALELWVESEIRLGRHRELLPELRTLVNDHPLHEWFHGQLISALHRAGRRGEALQAYRHLYTILKSELGLEPSAELRRLQAEILHATDQDAPRTVARRGVGPQPHVTPLWPSAAAS
ncbi:BTAD domain-containing putative transcriptional regulator [Streptomyces hydrogenans]|uniref:AfsR/SARP family transcriptional regulator n=1 Tax=Streptomyces hydrogenans TaxID=1873719 RepID=UPI0037FA2989